MFRLKRVGDALVAIVNGNLFRTSGTLQLNSCATTRDLGHLIAAA